jgi:hypothetical protein
VLRLIRGVVNAEKEEGGCCWLGSQLESLVANMQSSLFSTAGTTVLRATITYFFLLTASLSLLSVSSYAAGGNTGADGEDEEGAGGNTVVSLSSEAILRAR